MAPEVRRYLVGADGELGEDVAHSFANYGATGAAFYDNDILTDTVAYLSVPDQREYVVWNPTTMEITGTAPWPDLTFDEGLEPYHSYTDRGTVVVDGLDFHGIYGHNEDWDGFGGKPHIVVHDPSSHALVDSIAVPCPMMDVATVGGDGYLYVSGWSYMPLSMIAGRSPTNCAARIDLATGSRGSSSCAELADVRRHLEARRRWLPALVALAAAARVAAARPPVVPPPSPSPVLAPVGTVRGRIFLSGDRAAPIPGASVTIVDPTGVARVLTAGERGEVTLELAPGTYRVSAVVEGLGVAEATIVVAAARWSARPRPAADRRGDRRRGAGSRRAPPQVRRGGERHRDRDAAAADRRSRRGAGALDRRGRAPQRRPRLERPLHPDGLGDDQIRFFLDGVPLELAGYPFGLENVPIIGGPRHKYTVDAQLLHSLGLTCLVSGERSKLSFAIEAQNVTDERAFDFYRQERPGRAVYAKTTARF